MNTEERFNQVYQKILNENADYMEATREEAQIERRLNTISIILIILINIVIYIFVYRVLKNGDDLTTAGLAVGLAGIAIFISMLIVIKLKPYDNSKIVKYIQDFKTKIISSIIKSFEEQLEFTPQDRIISNRIRRSKV